MDDDELKAYFERSFTNITPTPEQVELIETLRLNYKVLMEMVIETGSVGRCRALALTNLETSLMYAVKGILLET